MFIDLVPNRNSPPAILLRESFREGSKVKKRTIANLSSWPASRIEVFRRLLRGELDSLPLQELFQGPIFGVLFVLKQIADQLGLTTAIGHSRLGKLALFLVLARLPHQGSRLSAVHRSVGTLGKDRVGPLSPLSTPLRETTPALVSLRRHQQLSGRRVQRIGRVRLQPRWQKRQAANRHRPADRRRRRTTGGAGIRG